jgi:hypothetical protein
MKSSKLADTEKSIEELRALQHHAQLDTQHLLQANEELKREVGLMHEQLETLRSQLDESSMRNHEAAAWNEQLQTELASHKQAAIQELREAVRQYQEISNRCASLETEVSYCRQQLEHNGVATEFDTDSNANGEAREMSYQDQQKLEALIGELERELAEGKSQVNALEETHQRLRETERICQELGEENRRLRDEISHWQGRFAASGENHSPLTMQTHLPTSHSEHGWQNDKTPQTQEEAASGTVSAVASGFESDGPTFGQNDTFPSASAAADSEGSSAARGDLVDSMESQPIMHGAEQIKAGQTISRWMAENWHFGAICAGVVIFVIAGVIAAKILFSEDPAPQDSALFSPDATTVEQAAEPVSKASMKAALPRRGAFQTIRPTQVFNEPSENSALIANIGAGVKVNVVDSRDGWLEIRSKHGRPPGFIRQETAVRVGSN